MRHASKATIVLLGPQTQTPTARDAIEPLLGPDDAVAAVTAGWEERESEQVELVEHLDRTVHNLELHRRAEEVFERDPKLDAALKKRYGTLLALQKLHRLRLRHLAPAAEELLRRRRRPDLLVVEQEAAIEDLRTLDAHHLRRVAEVQGAFDEEWKPSERKAVAEHREELARILEKTSVLCIAGGHVRILINRMLLFDVMGLLPKTMPIVAWSAGAMALAERIVLFHDSPPQGKGHAEVMGPGLDVFQGVVPLPHASRRLHLEDPVRVQLLSRRFPDAICAALDPNTQMTFDGKAWTATSSTLQLTHTGALGAVGASA